MARYAAGNHALGECARSGRKMRLRDMVSDGRYPGLLVDPAWYEARHPLEELVPVDDPVALRHPAPRQDRIDTEIVFPVFDVASGAAGAELFTLIERDHDLGDDGFRVALYSAPPAPDYRPENEITGAGYTPGGQALATHIDGERLVIADTAWVGATIGASHLLVYSAETGAGLFSAALGAVFASVRGRFAIRWDSARLVIDTTATRLRRVRV